MASNRSLWDHHGGENDPTIAVDTIENALKKAKLAIEGLAAGTQPLTQRALNVASTTATKTPATFDAATTIKPTGRKINGSNGFPFKPISQNEGKLAVLLPE